MVSMGKMVIKTSCEVFGMIFLHEKNPFLKNTDTFITTILNGYFLLDSIKIIQTTMIIMSTLIKRFPTSMADFLRRIIHHGEKIFPKFQMIFSQMIKRMESLIFLIFITLLLMKMIFMIVK